MNLGDFLYEETDDACGTCGKRWPVVLSIHHIDGNPTNDKYDNMIVLCRPCHDEHEKGIQPTTERIVSRKRHLIRRFITIYGLNAMKIAARNNFGVVAMPFLLFHLLDVDYMAKRENQMGYGAQEDATARFEITENGRRILYVLRES